MNRRGSARLPIWSATIRTIHWTLASCVAIAWLSRHGPGWLHDWTGYAALALVVIRATIGFFGPRKDRFRGFVVGLAGTFHYVRQVRAGREPRYLGHNPLGGWMILALLATSLAVCVSGWLFTTDRFWGLAWLEAFHAYGADLLVALVALHVAGVVFTSIRQGENLVAAMIHGRKPDLTPKHPEAPIPR